MLRLTVFRLVLFTFGVTAIPACGARSELSLENAPLTAGDEGLPVRDLAGSRGPSPAATRTPTDPSTTPSTTVTSNPTGSTPVSDPGGTPTAPNTPMPPAPEPPVGVSTPAVPVTPEPPVPMTPEPPLLPPMDPIPDAACMSFGDESIEGEVLGFDGVTSAHNFGDGATTACLEVTAPGVLCMHGHAVDAGPDYSNWGATLALQLTTANPDGTVSPMDATALGIASVEFTVSGLDFGPRLRPQFTMVDDPGIPTRELNYEYNPFVFGGNTGMDLSSDASYRLAISSFVQPVWSNLDVDGDGAPDRIDPSRLHAFGLQVVTRQGLEQAYDFCMSELRWLDRDGNVVWVTAPSR